MSNMHSQLVPIGRKSEGQNQGKPPLNPQQKYQKLMRNYETEVDC